MSDKQFGKGFAQKHFADKHFPGSAAAGGGLTIDVNPAIITTYGNAARVIAVSPAIVTTTAESTVLSTGGRLLVVNPALLATEGETQNVVLGRTVVVNPSVVQTAAQDLNLVLGILTAPYLLELDGFIPSGTKYEPLEIQSFPMVAGASFQISMPVKNSAGEDVDVSNSTPRLIVVRKPGATAVLDTDDDNVTATFPDVHTILFTVADEITQSLLGTYHWEAWVESGADRDVQIARGYVTFERSARLAA